MYKKHNHDLRRIKSFKDYERVQAELEAEIKTQESLEELKFAKAIKLEQINLARKFGDSDTVKNLTSEYKAICMDIEVYEKINAKLLEEATKGNRKKNSE